MGREATWAEIDLQGTVSAAKAKTWVAPADRMKMKRIHRVPLPRRALEVPAEAETMRDASGLLIPSASRKPLSDMTLSKRVKELGLDADVHGFGTSFRMRTQERTTCPREVAEMAPGHVGQDRGEAACARSDLSEKRRKMMGARAGSMDMQRDGLGKVRP